MKFSDEIDNQRRELNTEYIKQRWTQLYGLERETSLEGIKYLFLVNSGAAVAVLAFIGAVPAARNMVWPRLMLGLFVLGLILIGVLHILRYLRMTSLFDNWRNLVKGYYTNTIGWSEVIDADNKKSAPYKLADSIAYVSFVCFVSGAFVAMFNFSTLNTGDSNVRKETITATAQPNSTTTSPAKASDAR